MLRSVTVEGSTVTPLATLERELDNCISALRSVGAPHPLQHEPTAPQQQQQPTDDEAHAVASSVMTAALQANEKEEILTILNQGLAATGQSTKRIASKKRHVDIAGGPSTITAMSNSSLTPGGRTGSFGSSSFGALPPTATTTPSATAGGGAGGGAVAASPASKEELERVVGGDSYSMRQIRSVIAEELKEGPWLAELNNNKNEQAVNRFLSEMAQQRHQQLLLPLPGGSELGTNAASPKKKTEGSPTKTKDQKTPPKTTGHQPPTATTVADTDADGEDDESLYEVLDECVAMYLLDTVVQRDSDLIPGGAAGSSFAEQLGPLGTGSSSGVSSPGPPGLAAGPLLPASPMFSPQATIPTTAADLQNDIAVVLLPADERPLPTVPPLPAAEEEEAAGCGATARNPVASRRRREEGQQEASDDDDEEGSSSHSHSTTWATQLRELSTTAQDELHRAIGDPDNFLEAQLQSTGGSSSIVVFPACTGMVLRLQAFLLQRRLTGLRTEIPSRSRCTCTRNSGTDETVNNDTLSLYYLLLDLLYRDLVAVSLASKLRWYVLQRRKGGGAKSRHAGDDDERLGLVALAVELKRSRQVLRCSLKHTVGDQLQKHGERSAAAAAASAGGGEGEKQKGVHGEDEENSSDLLLGLVTTALSPMHSAAFMETYNDFHRFYSARGQQLAADSNESEEATTTAAVPGGGGGTKASTSTDGASKGKKGENKSKGSALGSTGTSRWEEPLISFHTLLLSLAFLETASEPGLLLDSLVDGGGAAASTSTGGGDVATLPKALSSAPGGGGGVIPGSNCSDDPRTHGDGAFLLDPMSFKDLLRALHERVLLVIRLIVDVCIATVDKDEDEEKEGYSANSSQDPAELSMLGGRLLPTLISVGRGTSRTLSQLALAGLFKGRKSKKAYRGGGGREEADTKEDEPLSIKCEYDEKTRLIQAFVQLERAGLGFHRRLPIPETPSASASTSAIDIRRILPATRHSTFYCPVTGALMRSLAIEKKKKKSGTSAKGNKKGASSSGGDSEEEEDEEGREHTTGTHNHHHPLVKVLSCNHAISSKAVRSLSRLRARDGKGTLNCPYCSSPSAADETISLRFV